VTLLGGPIKRLKLIPVVCRFMAVSCPLKYGTGILI
jgi:hypothetical protein